MATIRVLRTAKATLVRTFYLDEVGTDPTGVVGVSITRLDGTAVQLGNAAATANPGEVTFTFQGSDTLDELMVTWSATVGGDAIVIDQDRIEVVGGFYFGLAEGRAVDPVLTSITKFPTAKLIDCRIEAEDECERITGQAWVPRFCRETLYADGSGVLQLRWPFVRSVRAVSVNGSAWSVPSFSDLGLIYWSAKAPLHRQPVIVEYEHGHDRPNADITRGAKLRFKSLALEGRSALPDTAERRVVVDQDGSSTVYGAPTAEKTGLPAVDAIYGRYPAPQPGFG